ncbi:MAG: FhaA domain-containing protein [Nitrospiraceae bacterium]
MRIIFAVDDPSILIDQLQTFIDHLLKAMPKAKFPRAEVVAQWANEIQAGAKEGGDGHRYAPDQYTMSMHPKDYDGLTKVGDASHSDLMEALRASLESAGYRLTREPHITLATDPTLDRATIRVIAWHSSDPATGPIATEEPATEAPPAGAFFIVDGSQHYPLDRPLVNIGRRLDNHLVLEDPHISRRHAQLRVRGSRFIIYDLNSTAGMRVNGKVVQEWVLQPGDVVTLATVQLIYGEDLKGPPDVTPPYKPPFKPDIERDEVTPLDLSTVELAKLELGTQSLDQGPSKAKP